MLSSAKKSVPTREQFIQPYFIEIAPDGVIIAACDRSTNLFQKRNIYDFLDKNFAVVFAQLGTVSPALPTDHSGETLPSLIELSIRGPGAGVKPFLIRWTPVPLHTPEEKKGGWQLTGMRIQGGHYPPADPAEAFLPVEEAQIQAGLVKYVSDIIITTDLE